MPLMDSVESAVLCSVFSISARTPNWLARFAAASIAARALACAFADPAAGVVPQPLDVAVRQPSAWA